MQPNKDNKDDKDKKLDEKSYRKASKARALHRNEIFQANRFNYIPVLTYLNDYDTENRNILKESLTGPIPDPLPPLSLHTISYYRRSYKPAFVTRLSPEFLDPHLTYESLWILAGIENEEQFPNYQQIVKEYQQDLPLYLASKYPEIREMAIIAAGNKIIGKPEDIIKIAEEDEEQLWVLSNHIYDRKIINLSLLYKYLIKGAPTAFKTIYQMTNNYKDEIIESILKDEQTLTTIIQALNSTNLEIQSYSIRIIGNILAEPDDHSCEIMKYGLLQSVYPLLSSTKKEIRKNACWLLANYVYDTGAAKEVLFYSKLNERLISMFLSEMEAPVRIELYFIFSHLIEYGDKETIFTMAIKENLLEKCENDLEKDSQDLVVVTLSLIYKLLVLGEEFPSEDEEGENNIFAVKIMQSRLLVNIKRKSYHGDQQISDLSMQIVDKVQERGCAF